MRVSHVMRPRQTLVSRRHWGPAVAVSGEIKPHQFDLSEGSDSLTPLPKRIWKSGTWTLNELWSHRGPGVQNFDDLTGMLGQGRRKPR